MGDAPDSFYSVAVTVAPHEAEAFEAALGEEAVSTTVAEAADGVAWTVSALFQEPPERAEIAARLIAMSAALGRDAAPDPDFAEIAPQDWVFDSLANFPPIRIGRYWIAGNHVEAQPPPGAYPLYIDASVAFGTGHHGSTAGCLAALENLRRHIRPRRCLDLGCGTGILAMAAALTFPTLYSGWGRVVATDIDPEAIAIGRATIHANGLAKAVTCRRAANTHDRLLNRRGPYDLVFANILAGPLKALAPAIWRQTAPGGHVVLSGLLNRQAGRLLARYRNQGFIRERVLDRDGWATLVLRRPG